MPSIQLFFHSYPFQNVDINSLCVVQRIGQKVDEYKKVVSEDNMEEDVARFVLMETAFKNLEAQAEKQKNKLSAPVVLQQNRPGPQVSMPKGEVPFTRLQLPALKPGEFSYRYIASMPQLYIKGRS